MLDLPRTPTTSRSTASSSIDSFVDRVVDAVGAGDALLAYATLAMLVDRQRRDRVDPRLDGRGLRMRARRQHPGHARRCPQQDRRGRAPDRTSARLQRCASSSSGLGVQGHKRRARCRRRLSSRSVDPVNAEADYQRIEDVPLDRYDAVLACIPDEPKIELLSYLRRQRQARAGREAAVGRATTQTSSTLERTRAAQRRRLLHRLQSSLRAALRAHARPDRVGRARRDLSLPHVLRQRHGAAGARLGLARPGRGGAARSRLASARHRAASGSAISTTTFASIVGARVREPRARPCRHRAAKRRGRASSWR